MSARAGAEGIGGLLVERDTPGFAIGERDRTMGLRGIPEGRLHFERCRVGREQLLVGPPDGFKKLMRAYNSQRLGAATVALGLAQGAYEQALAYAQARRQFGRPIADFQGIRWKLAEMAVALDAARLLIHRAACTSVDGFPDPLESAKAKTFAAEMAQTVTNQALQIHGAAGYGRTLPLERMVRDARMFAIGGGTVEMMRNLIADRILPGKADFRR
jgi:alkylation response protein AidB-like acyl-CoA dehydrogenase